MNDENAKANEAEKNILRLFVLHKKRRLAGIFRFPSAVGKAEPHASLRCEGDRPYYKGK
jgi:hypothetical protein